MFLDEKAFGEPGWSDEPEMDRRFRLGIDVCLWGWLFTSWAAYDLMFMDVESSLWCGKMSMMFGCFAASLRLVAAVRLYR